MTTAPIAFKGGLVRAADQAFVHGCSFVRNIIVAM
jgi:hypothetical protein